jgi:hypothetical protein
METKTANKEESVKTKNKTLGVNMKAEMADAIEERAKSMQISTAKYCKIILQQWFDSGKILSLNEK